MRWRREKVMPEIWTSTAAFPGSTVTASVPPPAPIEALRPSVESVLGSLIPQYVERKAAGMRR